MLFKDISELNADDVRQELFYYMQENPCSIVEISKEMGMSHITLEAYLYGRKKLAGSRGTVLKTVLKVKKFLRDKYAQRDAEQEAL